MIIRFVGVLIISFLFVDVAFGQEIKRKRKVTTDFHEDYYVLKSDKNVKQGQYVKFERAQLGNAIIEMGFYEQNQKSGEWQLFYRNGRSLKEEGNFSNNLKNGLWTEYYKTQKKDSKDIILNEAISVTETGTIEIAKEDLKIASQGVYLNGNKNGAWNYYNSKGELTYKYNHSKNKLIYPDTEVLLNISLPFLGGIDRLNNFLLQHRFSDIKMLISGNGEISQAINIIRGKPTFELISATGNKNIIKIFDEIISTIPSDWISDKLSSKFANKLSLKLSIIGNEIDISFQQVN